MAEKIFAIGFKFKRPLPNAPSFVKGSMSIKVEEAIPFLKSFSKNGWVNLDLKESKQGALYLEVNTWSKDKPNP